MSDKILHHQPSSEPARRDDTEFLVLQAYRDLDSPEAPDALDRRILARARRNVPARSRFIPGLRNNWGMPLGLAASALLAVSLVLDNLQETSPGLAPAGRESGSTYPGRLDIPGTAGQALPSQDHAARQSAGAEFAETDAAAPAPAEEALQTAPAAAPAVMDKQELRNRRARTGAAKSSDSPPMDIEAWMVHIQSLLDQGERDSARQELERLLAQYPDREDAKQMLDALSGGSP